MRMTTTNNSPKKVPLSGLEKIAVLMNVLGKEKSFELMKEMRDTDVRRLLKIMGNMRKAPIALINAVLREYLEKLSEREDIIFEDNLTTHANVKEGLGEERAKLIFGGKGANLVQRKPLTSIETIDPKSLAEYLVEEHPQTIALILSHLEVQRQMLVLRHFPEALRPEILLRMANLETVSPEKIEELDDMLRRELVTAGKGQRNPLGGVQAVVQLVTNMDTKMMNSIMLRLEDKDPLLAEELRSYIFTFLDIARLDEKAVQMLLREVPGDKLLLALKSAPQELRDKICNGMSSRAADMLRDDLQAMGPTKVSDVEEAQRAIVAVAKRLAEEGKINLGGDNAQDLIP
jgi:flagellar motor switch protein FliG